jgi:hypothetical protein
MVFVSGSLFFSLLFVGTMVCHQVSLAICRVHSSLSPPVWRHIWNPIHIIGVEV